MSLSVWKRRIKYEYNQIKRERNTQIQNAWRENWNKCVQDLEDASNQIRVEWPTVEAPKSKKPQMYFFKECKPLPQMFNWVLTPRSCMVEKENVMLNIPYIDHKSRETETFVRELLKSYGGIIDGQKNSNKLDNEMLVELVQALQLNYMQQELIPDQSIFEAIGDYFFKNVTPDELKQKFIQLTGQQETEAAKAPTNSCKHALQTFKKYFCRRCYIYNCDLHRDQEAVENTSQIKRKSIFRMRTPVEYCGSNCYKLLETATEADEPIQPNLKLEDTELPSDSFDIPSTSQFAASMNNTELGMEVNCKPETAEQEWSDDEKTLYQVLYKVYQKKYCTIAQIMLTKTCQQVYAFAQDEIVPDAIEEPFQSKMSTLRCKMTKGWRLYGRRQLAQKDPSSKKIYHYTPCNHAGKCKDNCSCVSLGNACEKYCHCSLECSNRFRGCTCRARCNTNVCPCYISVRECDPDLCRNCGAAKYDLQEVVCKNISIQRGLRKHLLLAPSDIAGWGIFLKDGVQKDEFISEYVGEIISQDEANRRGKVYDKQKCSFLFDLNEDFVVDATYKGSKIRFANHSINPNCYAKVLMVLGTHRIGFFAKRNILPGEELFFDYRYSLTEQLQFVSIEREVDSA